MLCKKKKTKHFYYRIFECCESKKKIRYLYQINKQRVIKSEETYVEFSILKIPEQFQLWIFIQLNLLVNGLLGFTYFFAAVILTQIFS